jgi:type I restriction enzyme R subunit
VIYTNGISVAMIEFKPSTVEMGDGVRQLITNQEEIFNKALFSTAHFCWPETIRKVSATEPSARPSSFSWIRRKKAQDPTAHPKPALGSG